MKFSVLNYGESFIKVNHSNNLEVSLIGEKPVDYYQCCNLIQKEAKAILFLSEFLSPFISITKLNSSQG